MKEGLAALTKLVKVVMSYRPDPQGRSKPAKSKRSAQSAPPRRRRVERVGVKSGSPSGKDG